MNSTYIYERWIKTSKSTVFQTPDSSLGSWWPEPIPAAQGTMGTDLSWTGHPSIAGPPTYLSHSDKGNADMPSPLMCTSLDVGGSRSPWRKPMQTWRWCANSSQWPWRRVLFYFLIDIIMKQWNYLRTCCINLFILLLVDFRVPSHYFAIINNAAMSILV